MVLKEQIQKDLKEALKTGNNLEVSVLRMLNAAIHNKEIEKRTKLSKSEPIEKLEELSKLTDEEVIEVISAEAKKRKEAILLARRSPEGEGGERGRMERFIEKEKKELGILEKYLPEQLSEEEIRKLVEEAIKKTNAREPKEMGRVMAELMPKIKGRVDGGVVNRIVKEFLTPKTE